MTFRDSCRRAGIIPLRPRRGAALAAVLLAAALAGCAGAGPKRPRPFKPHPQARILFGKAEGYFFKALYEDAVREYTAALDLEPRYAEAFRCRAAAHAILDRDAAALADYAAAIEIEPGYDEAWFGRGLYKFWRGRYADAVDDFDRTIVLDELNAAAYLYKAQACEKIGRLREASEARAAYAHCVSRVEDPGDAAKQRPPVREIALLGL